MDQRLPALGLLTASEFRYNEFQAIDQPLDQGEQPKVRELSARARITATTFVNEYHWGNFRGDQRKMDAAAEAVTLALARKALTSAMLCTAFALSAQRRHGGRDSTRRQVQLCIDGQPVRWGYGVGPPSDAMGVQVPGGHKPRDLTGADERGNALRRAHLDLLTAQQSPANELLEGALRGAADLQPAPRRRLDLAIQIGSARSRDVVLGHVVTQLPERW